MLDVEYQVSSTSKPGQGMGIWFTREPLRESGSLVGGPAQFEGVGLVVLERSLNKLDRKVRLVEMVAVLVVGDGKPIMRHAHLWSGCGLSALLSMPPGIPHVAGAAK